ncbi:hypothetical protein OSB04_016639 [Centaurea solstitialis]|uniref:DUF4283 domain-containing protein n=1 Tax=Centaurea solstitialis TaxID=347529 RepID=A0AA38T303_9ASTR|nr:hypothetical protein OSB04_016639 [Centaurea solstitialis]
MLFDLIMFVVGIAVALALRFNVFVSASRVFFPCRLLGNSGFRACVIADALVPVGCCACRYLGSIRSRLTVLSGFVFFRIEEGYCCCPLGFASVVLAPCQFGGNSAPSGLRFLISAATVGFLFLMGFEDLFEGTVIHEPAHVPRVEADKRKSVFDRLSSAPCDSRLEFSEDVKRKLSFADVVGDTKDDSLSFFPLENKAQSTIRIPVTLAQEAVKTITLRLLATFLFNDEGGCKQVIDAGPLMIRGVPLFVAPWDPLKGLSKPVHDSCPLWIKLHNIPLVAFNKEGIGRIASALGVPKKMDACTSAMCDKAWGHPGFAKVLVEVWAVGDLKRELEVVIPNLSGGEDAKVMIRVEYIWEPTQCSHCLVFGHKSATCVKAVVHAKKKQKDQVVDDDGFVRVERKQWKPKRVDQASSSGVIKEAETLTQEESVIVLDKEVTDGVPRVEENENLGQQENVNAPDKEVTVGVSTAVQSLPKEGHGKVDVPVPPILQEPSHSIPTLVEPVVRNMQQQQKPQIRGILKNPNRNPNRPLVIEE